MDGSRSLMSPTIVDKDSNATGHGVSQREAFRVWLRIALLSFGGPAGQIAVMHRILVEEKHWISERRFLHALNYCMLLPGPEAQQLATYVGWLMHRTRGGILAGGLFIIPGILSIMALSYVYAGWGRVPVIQALFFGLKAAVLAIVLEAVVRIGRRALKNPVMIALAAAAFLGIFFFRVPFPLIVFGAALIGFLGDLAGFPAFRVGGGHGAGNHKDQEALVDSLLGDELPEHARPTVARSLRASAVWLALWLVPVVALLVLLGASNVFSQIAVFFSKMALVTFGGAYAVLAYVAQEAVEHYHWLKPGEMLDGLGMAETTPGPLIMVLQFVGFMAAYRDPGTLSPMLAGTFGGCSRPGSPSRRASCGFFWARRSWKYCGRTSRSMRRSPRSRPPSSASCSIWRSGSPSTRSSARFGRYAASGSRSRRRCSQASMAGRWRSRWRRRSRSFG
jgi:chromate transporter